MAAAREKTLAHSRSRVSNEDGDVFKMAATAKRVRRTGYEMLDAEVKINKMAEKAEVQFKKNRKNRHVLHVRVLGIRQSVRGLVFAVHCFFFVILKLGVMGLSVLYCGTPYRYLIQCCSSEHIIFLFHEALGNKLCSRYIVTNLSLLNIVINPSFLTLMLQLKTFRIFQAQMKLEI